MELFDRLSHAITKLALAAQDTFASLPDESDTFIPGTPIPLPDEVLVLIFDGLRSQKRHLYTRDYLACSLVCKQWNRLGEYGRATRRHVRLRSTFAALKYVYQDLEFVGPDQHDRLPKLYRALRRNAYAASSVEKLVFLAPFNPILHDILKLCVNLHDVAISQDAYRNDQSAKRNLETMSCLWPRSKLERLALTGFDPPSLRYSLPKCASLQCLSLRGVDFRLDTSSESCDPVRNLRELRLIRCTWSDRLHGYIEELIYQVAPDLEAMLLRLTIPPIPAGNVLFFSLRTLVLEHLGWRDITSISEAAPNVADLTLEHCRLDSTPSSSWYTLPAKLEYLAIRITHFSTALHIANVLLADPNWLPQLSQLPQVTFVSGVRPSLVLPAQQSGLEHWTKRIGTGTEATMREKAMFLVENQNESIWL